ncbi:MAG: hypothetical protein SGI83_11105 [Bacteroidota bacterium]|nr:hypothetical protein [Bacteroidota bacterium]
MEIKRNEATLNRPLGNRIIDAPYVFADLGAFTNQVKDEAAWEKNDRNAITVFKSAIMTIVLTALKESAVSKDNVVDGFLVVQVLQGNIRIETQEQDGDMEESQLMVFHPGIPHSIEAKSDSLLLLTTYAMKS